MSRVVPAISDVMDLVLPNILLNKDDFPELGGPTNKTLFFSPTSSTSLELFLMSPNRLIMSLHITPIRSIFSSLTPSSSEKSI